jgi:hypothetical protein
MVKKLTITLKIYARFKDSVYAPKGGNLKSFPGKCSHSGRCLEIPYGIPEQEELALRRITRKTSFSSDRRVAPLEKVVEGDGTV